MTGKRELKVHTRDLLLRLGSCDADVATVLHGFGVQAAPKNPQDCAIAVYLKAILGTERRVNSLVVNRKYVMVLLGGLGRFHWHNVVKVQLPQPVCQFIVAFDGGAYPELVREGWRLPRDLVNLDNNSSEDGPHKGPVRTSSSSFLRLQPELYQW